MPPFMVTLPVKVLAASRARAPEPFLTRKSSAAALLGPLPLDATPARVKSPAPVKVRVRVPEAAEVAPPRMRSPASDWRV